MNKKFFAKWYSSGIIHVYSVKNSQEYKNKDASDTQYVLMLYKTMLGREADTAGVTDWVLQLRNGASREAVYTRMPELLLVARLQIMGRRDVRVQEKR